MAELKKLLSALIKGNRSFEQVNAAFQQFLARSPDKAPLVAKLLRAARDAGLPHPMYVALSGDLTCHIDMDRDPEATILELDDDVDHPDPSALALRVATPDDEALPPVEHRDLAARIDVAPDGTKAATEPLAVSEQSTVVSGAQGEAADEATQMEIGCDDNPTTINPNLDPVKALDEKRNARVYIRATKPNPANEDATSANADTTDQTIPLEAEPDFDVFYHEPLASADETTDPDTGASWPTIREQRHPGVSRTFRKGDHLRNRFELMSQLGEGGMGAVWKGKDLLKEEARDRNPFVAIKLLQGDFKQYPEAFIALQRETAKQQRLAHPNIATVYDFDRDDSTNTIFMTMEVLEGQPLDAFIRKLPTGGLSVDQAMPIIEQLCNGLAYAHSHGLVHADLKPGNCFYTKDGTIKLLDFGIARASKTKVDAEGETTLFDPGELGALTPAYATVEMFEGVDPDPRDDIYALAIMTYQLLTGRHPYDKKAAPKARELGLKAKSIAKLNKRQNRALMRGLVFEREDRTPTVEDFFESVRPKKSRTAMVIAIVLALLLIVGVGAYGPVVDLIKKNRREQIISIIDQRGITNIRRGLDQAKALGDPDQLSLILNDQRTKNAIVAHVAEGGETRVDEWLALIAPFDLEWKRDIKEVEQVKSTIMNVYNSKIHQAFDVKRNRYEFATASALIAELDRLYPDSEKVLQRKTLLNREKALELAALSDEYTRHLQQGRLLPEASGRDIGDVIEVVGQIDPEHPLLGDRRLRFRYAELAEAAINGEAYGRAGALLRTGLTHAPGDSKLSDLRFRLRSSLERIANEHRAAEIELRLAPRLASLDGLVDFLETRNDLILLGELSPESKVLVEVQEKLRSLFNNQMRNSTAQRSWAVSEGMLLDFSILFDIPYLMKQRRLLSETEEQAGYTLEMTPERQSAVDERVRSISELLANAEFSGDWEIQLKIAYKELIALLPTGDPVLEQVRKQTARLYLQKAKTALESERYVEALTFVERGRVFYPGLRHFDDFGEAIVMAQENWRIRRAQERRLARIDALKNGFLAAAERNDVKDAGAELAAIRAEGLPANDPFLAREAPLELANAYLRLARSRVEGERPDFEQALALASKGLEVAPEIEALRLAVASYERELNKRRLEVALRRLFDGSGKIDVVAAKTNLEALERTFPERYPHLRSGFAETRGNRIRELANSKDLRIPSLHQRMDEYRALFPDKAQALHQSLASIVGKRIRAARILSARDVEILSASLSDFRAFAPTDYASLSKDLSSQLSRRILALEKTDKRAAASLLQASIKHFGETSFSGLQIEPEPGEIR